MIVEVVLISVAFLLAAMLVALGTWFRDPHTGTLRNRVLRRCVGTGALALGYTLLAVNAALVVLIAVSEL